MREEEREGGKEQAGKERGQMLRRHSCFQWTDIPRRGFSRQMRAYSLLAAIAIDFWFFFTRAFLLNANRFWRKDGGGKELEVGGVLSQ